MAEKVIRQDPSEEILKTFGKEKTTETSKTYIVFWKESNILTVGSIVQGESSDCRILPGVNKISARTWGYLERHPIQRMNIEEGSLKLLSKNGDLDWDEFPTDEGVQYIKGLSDIVELERVAKFSKKAQIKLAAEERIEEIMKLIKPKE